MIDGNIPITVLLTVYFLLDYIASQIFFPVVSSGFKPADGLQYVHHVFLNSTLAPVFCVLLLVLYTNTPFSSLIVYIL